MLTSLNRRLLVSGTAVLVAGFLAGAMNASQVAAQAQPDHCPGCPPGIIIRCPTCSPWPCHGCPIVRPCPPDPLLPPPPGVPTPAPPPTPTPGPATGLQYKVCPQILTSVPAALQAMALAEPWRFRGYGELRNPNVPYHPMWNTYRTWLSVENMGVPYSRCNPVLWKSGCP
jgi:hypothetical protein